MGMIWFAVVCGIVGAIGAIVRTQGRNRQSDLGEVSRAWVAEHRQSHSDRDS